MNSHESISTKTTSQKGNEDQHREELQFVARTLQGELEAFGQLIKPAEQMAYQAIFNLVGSREDTEDILQESTLKAFRSLARFEGRSAFSTWFYRICINTALEKLRKKTPKITHSLDDPIFTEEGRMRGSTEDWTHNPEVLSLSTELKETLEDAIQKLPEEYRVVLILKDREGLSNKEISETVGESVAAVKSRLHRARLFVREQKECLPSRGGLADNG